MKDGPDHIHFGLPLILDAEAKGLGIWALVVVTALIACVGFFRRLGG